MKHVLKVTNVK